MSVSDLRVTGDLVKEVYPTSLSSSELSPYILTANRLVEDQLTGKSIDSETLIEIERWLAAHFASVATATPIKREDFGKGEYTVDYDLGNPGTALSSTPFGRAAIALDTSGTLAGINEKRARMKISFTRTTSS